jgi:low affinity Fe/Cu permease
MTPLSQRFSRVAQWTANAAGTWQAFTGALAIVILWLIAGLHFGYANELYQLTINSGTTIVTFLMVFLIQSSQNRDTMAIKLQLAELIRATEHARNNLASLEDLTEDQLKSLAERFAALAHRADEAP